MSDDQGRSNQATTEHLLFSYLTALESADFDGVAAVLQAAMIDPELDRLITEANRALHDEAGLSPLAEDARRVQALLRVAIPSGFAEQAEPLSVTVGMVAARLFQDRRLSDMDRALSRHLVADDRPVPPSLDRAALSHLAAAIGEGSLTFWRHFRHVAIMAWLGHGHQRTQFAATRAAMTRALGNLPDASQARPSSAVIDPIEAARRAYAACGRDLDQAEMSIAPLDDIIGAFPISNVELPGLTYRKAAEFLAKETGQIISVPERQTGTLAGFLFCMIESDTLLGCILVNQDDPIERRRFSAAHELGHYMLHFLPLLARTHVGSGITLLWEGLAYTDDEHAPSGMIEGAQILPAVGPESVLLGGDWRELEANKFAAEILIPAAACHAAVGRHRRRFGNGTPVRLLSNEFLVSQWAMERRLSDLGLIDAVASRV